MSLTRRSNSARVRVSGQSTTSTATAAEEPPERQAQWPPGTEWIKVTGFIVEAPDDFEPTLNFEHDDYRWCDREEAVKLFQWPDVGEALEELWRRAK